MHCHCRSSATHRLAADDSSVVALARDDVWVVGLYGLLTRWNGREWQSVPTRPFYDNSSGTVRAGPNTTLP